jgi:hypothetical protein
LEGILQEFFVARERSDVTPMATRSATVDMAVK